MIEDYYQNYQFDVYNYVYIEFELQQLYSLELGTYSGYDFAYFNEDGDLVESTVGDGFVTAFFNGSGKCSSSDPENFCPNLSTTITEFSYNQSDPTDETNVVAGRISGFPQSSDAMELRFRARLY